MRQLALILLAAALSGCTTDPNTACKPNPPGQALLPQVKGGQVCPQFHLRPPGLNGQSVVANPRGRIR